MDKKNAKKKDKKGAKEEKKDEKLEREEEKKKQEEEEAAYVGYFERTKVTKRHTFGGAVTAVTLVELEGVEKVDGGVLVAALAGVGTTSTVVGGYIIGQLKLPLVAVLHSLKFPAVCSIHKWVPAQSIRVYGNKQICVAVGDHQLSAVANSPLLWNVTEALTDFGRRHKCSNLIAIDGFPIRSSVDQIRQYVAKQRAQMNKEPSVLEKQISLRDEEKDPFGHVGYLSNSKEIGPLLKEKGHRPIKTGQIIGLAGSLLSFSFISEPNDPPLTAILAPDPVEVPDQRGALLAVKLLREIFKLDDLDLTELEAQADRLAAKIDEAIQDVQQQVAQQMQRQMQSKAPPSGMYM